MSAASVNLMVHEPPRPSWGELEDQQLCLESEISSQYCFEDIGKSPALQKVLKQVAVLAPTDSNVPLHGETGTGKELIARAIHKLSSRRERTFASRKSKSFPGRIGKTLITYQKNGWQPRRVAVMNTPTIFQWYQILRKHHRFTMFQAVRGALWLAQ